MNPNPNVNLSQVILATTYNSFKNDGFLYTGSINFPTSLTADQFSITTVPVALEESPQFSKFYAHFQEFLDANVGNPAQWYPANVGGQFSVGVQTTTGGVEPWVQGAIYPVISSGEILVTAAIFNPNNVTITLTPLNVPFVFVEYTLAN